MTVPLLVVEQGALRVGIDARRVAMVETAPPRSSGDARVLALAAPRAGEPCVDLCITTATGKTSLRAGGRASLVEVDADEIHALDPVVAAAAAPVYAVVFPSDTRAAILVIDVDGVL
jgi:hypothetical protein